MKTTDIIQFSRFNPTTGDIDCTVVTDQFSVASFKPWQSNLYDNLNRLRGLIGNAPEDDMPSSTFVLDALHEELERLFGVFLEALSCTVGSYDFADALFVVEHEVQTHLESYNLLTLRAGRQVETGYKNFHRKRSAHSHLAFRKKVGVLTSVNDESLVLGC